MDVTQSTSDFSEHLRAGDVIVIDSNDRAISGLVQWADNAPANHSTLMIDNVTTMMANEPADAGGPALEKKPIHDLLDMPRVRSAVALRADDLREKPSLSQAVVERAELFFAAGPSFAIIDLMLLAPAALRRSYRNDPDLQKPMMQMVMYGLWLAEIRALRRVEDNDRTLFCSEFVYRCLTDADVEVTIDDPIVRPNRLGVDGEPKPGPWGEDLSVESDMWDWMSDHNDGLAPVDGLNDPTNPEQAELVTPGDLWRSPSLQPTIQLVKEPTRSPLNP